MSDIDWQEITEATALNLIKDMVKLPISCFHYRYWGESSLPLVKMDVSCKIFYKNPEEL